MEVSYFSGFRNETAAQLELRKGNLYFSFV
jgi:hypothetical protein